MKTNIIYNENCFDGLKRIPSNSVQLVLTDIPYNEVNRDSNGLRNLDKKEADVLDIDVCELTRLLCDKTSGSIYMFCGINQVSDIRRTMDEQGLSTRLLIWEKTNPSPMNGEKLWLSGIECCVYGKKSGATFNARCKNAVLKFPTQQGSIHPTMKPVKLFEHLIRISSNIDDVVLDPFMGSGTTAVACLQNCRKFIGFELCKDYYDASIERVNKITNNGKRLTHDKSRLF